MLSENLIKKFATTRAEKISKNMDTIISFNDINLDDLNEKDAGQLLLKNLDIRGQDMTIESKTLSHKNQLKSVLQKDGTKEKTALSRSIIELLGSDENNKRNIRQQPPKIVTLEVPDVINNKNTNGTKKKVKTISLRKEKSKRKSKLPKSTGGNDELEVELEEEEETMEGNVEQEEEIEENEQIDIDDSLAIDLVEEEIEFMKKSRNRNQDLSIMSIPPPPEELDIDFSDEGFSLPLPPSILEETSTNEEHSTTTTPLIVIENNSSSVVEILPSTKQKSLPESLKLLLSQDPNKIDSFSDLPQVISYRELPDEIHLEEEDEE